MRWRLLILFLAHGFFLAIGGLCFLNSYEYKSYLGLPDDLNYILPGDSLVISPYFYIASDTRFDVNVIVEHLSGSLRFKNFDVSIISVDKPKQTISLTHVLAYQDTICNEDINRSYVQGLTFADLPDHYMLMTPQRDFNSFRFFFETRDVNESHEYRLKIAGTFVYKGRIITFSKEIIAIRKKKFIPVQMMT